MSLETVLRYHDATKHHFNRFARSLGYLDWATQPDPFRRYAGAALIELPARLRPRRSAGALTAPRALHGSLRRRIPPLFDGAVRVEAVRPLTLGAARQPVERQSPPHRSLRRLGRARLPLRAAEHALEVAQRARRQRADATERCPSWSRLTSIHWREAWKYGERAFRYCQHDAGHAIAALRFAAALLGWRLALLPRWSDAQIATLLGLDRDADYRGAEREEPECIAVVDAGRSCRNGCDTDPAPLLAAARAAPWQGVANRLSASHVEWPIIDEVAEATRYPGSGIGDPGSGGSAASAGDGSPIPDPGSRTRSARITREIILQRRSAIAFNGGYALGRDTFLDDAGAAAAWRSALGRD